MKLVYIVLTYVTLVSTELETWDIIKFRDVSVNLNELVDRFNPQIAQFIVKRGLDPLELPHTERKLWMQLPNSTEPMVYKADLVLHSGTLKHLSTLKRYGNANLAYINKILHMDIGVEFKLLQGTYNYILKMVWFNLKGRIIASAENVHAKINVTFNTRDCTLALNKLELQTSSPIKVIIENKNGQVDWINTVIVNIIIPFFKNTIMNVVQEKATNAIRTYFSEINRTIAACKILTSILEQLLLNRN